MSATSKLQRCPRLDSTKWRLRFLLNFCAQYYSLVYTTMLYTIVYTLSFWPVQCKLGKYIFLKNKNHHQSYAFHFFAMRGPWKLQVIFDWLTASKIWIWWFLPVSGRFISCPPHGAPRRTPPLPAWVSSVAFVLLYTVVARAGRRRRWR